MASTTPGGANQPTNYVESAVRYGGENAGRIGMPAYSPEEEEGAVDIDEMLGGGEEEDGQDDTMEDYQFSRTDRLDLSSIYFL